MVSCYNDETGVCCLIERHLDGQLCRAAKCYDFDQCVWEEFIPLNC